VPVISRSQAVRSRRWPIDLASVMQAGRWKTTAMPMRYREDIQAGLGGMARTAKAQGR
jgi:hypothetical protein